MRKSLIAAAFVALGVPCALAAQERQCSFETAGGTRQSSAEPGMIYVDSAFVLTCDDGLRVSANSGRMNQQSGEVFLSGNVHFEDPERRLTAVEATYFRGTAHLIAQGDVVFEDRLEGSTLRGPNLDYFRVTEERPVSQMNATARPTLTMVSRDDPDTAEPIELVADRVAMLGDDDLSAFGGVVITRSDLRATSGEARHDASTGALELRELARVRTEEYELSADVIQTRLVEDALEFLNARSGAALRGEDLEVTGNELRIFFAGEEVERAIALADPEDEDSRAVAVSASFRIDADSLDAVFVEQKLNRVYAVGDARGETIDTSSIGRVETPNLASETPEVGAAEGEPDVVRSAFRSDWIRGDTIIGYFVDRIAGSSPNGAASAESDAVEEREGDPESTVDLERLVAIGNAQSLYRLAADDDTTGERRNLNFLVGERIELVMADGELEVAEVTGLQYGMYLEATPEASPVVDEEPPADAPSADAIRSSPADDL